jgi:transglycosylase-like protein
MRPKTTALALASALLVPAAAAAAQTDDPPSPTAAALRAPLAGHATVAAQMRAERRANRRDDISRRIVRRARHKLRRDATRQRRNSPVLEAIAQCESGGNPRTDTGNGFYGKYQFTISTWNAVGGKGNPARAPEVEQDRRAAMLYARAGASPWPVCGQ